MTAAEFRSAMRKIVTGAIIAEYGCISIVDSATFDLKSRVVRLANASRSVQSMVINHPNIGPIAQEMLKRELNSNEVMMMSEIVESLWGLNEHDLEDILNAIKRNTDASNPNPSV